MICVYLCPVFTWVVSAISLRQAWPGCCTLGVSQLAVKDASLQQGIYSLIVE